MKLAIQAENWLQQLETRKRDPASRATLTTYRSGLNHWILPRMGDLELEDVKNGALKRFVEQLAKARLSVATINLWTNCVKQIVASARDSEGNLLYPRSWSNEFIDLPVIKRGSQRQPSITAGQVQGAIDGAGGVYRALYCVAAATGMRIGELLAIRARQDNGYHTTWWPVDRVIQVRKSIWREKEQEPKTPAAIRDVDIPTELNDYLVRWIEGYQPGEQHHRVGIGDYLFQNGVHKRLQESMARRDLQRAEIRGFHCFRRFRATRLRAAGVPEDLVKFWIGHGDKDITDRYSKLAQDVALRREWVEKVGLGFKLPEA